MEDGCKGDTVIFFFFSFLFSSFVKGGVIMMMMHAFERKLQALDIYNFFFWGYCHGQFLREELVCQKLN